MTGINLWVLAVAGLQFIAAGWAGWQSDWKMAGINLGVGVANAILATMAKT